MQHADNCELLDRGNEFREHAECTFGFSCAVCAVDCGSCLHVLDDLCVYCADTPAGEAIRHHRPDCNRRRAAASRPMGGYECKHDSPDTPGFCDRCWQCTCEHEPLFIDFKLLAETERLLDEWDGSEAP